MWYAGVLSSNMSSLQTSGLAHCVSGPDFSEPQNHQSSNGSGYPDIPIAEATGPALRSGSPARRTLTISPRDMVTMAK